MVKKPQEEVDHPLCHPWPSEPGSPVPRELRGRGCRSAPGPAPPFRLELGAGEEPAQPFSTGCFLRVWGGGSPDRWDAPRFSRTSSGTVHPKASTWAGGQLPEVTRGAAERRAAYARKLSHILGPPRRGRGAQSVSPFQGGPAPLESLWCFPRIPVHPTPLTRSPRMQGQGRMSRPGTDEDNQRARKGRWRWQAWARGRGKQ